MIVTEYMENGSLDTFLRVSEGSIQLECTVTGFLWTACPSALLIRREFGYCRPPASLKLARDNEASHNTGTNACAPLPVLALWLIQLHNVQTHVGGVAVVS